MKDTELREMRDRALYAAYLKGIREGTVSTLNEAADYARNQPAPRFFISPWNLAKYFVQVEKHRPMNRVNSSTRHKIRELYSRYQAYLRDHPDNTYSRTRICEILVDEPAPRFYMGQELAKKIIVKERKAAMERLARKREG